MFGANWGAKNVSFARRFEADEWTGCPRANRSSIFHPFAGAPGRTLDVTQLFSKKAMFTGTKSVVPANPSRRFAGIGLRPRRIREEIIGRTLALFRCKTIGSRRENLASLVLEQPSGDHCSGKLFHPLIKNRRGLLS